MDEEKQQSLKCCEIPKPDERQRLLADLYLDPNFNTCASLSTISAKADCNDGKQIGLDSNGAFYALQKANERIKAGDLEEIEFLLANQIRTLDALFSRNLQSAHLTERVDLLKVYSNIALKAQRQCRATAEALSEIKNPKPYIQNNKAKYQQVNNGVCAPRTHEEEIKSANELLEQNDYETKWLDGRATQEAIGDDKELEAVGEEYRS